MKASRTALTRVKRRTLLGPSPEAVRFFEQEQEERNRRFMRKQQTGGGPRKTPTLPTFNLPPFEEEEANA